MTRATFLLLLLAGPAFGQAPAPAPPAEPRAVIAGKALVAPGSSIFLDARASVAEPPTALRWRWKGAGAEPPFVVLYDQAGRPAYLTVFDPAPGPYRFILVATGKAADGTPTADADVVDVTVGAAPPPPKPEPGPIDPPKPDPAPQPVALIPAGERGYASVVIDTAQVNPGMSAAAQSKPAFDAAASLNYSYKVVAHNGTDAEALNLPPYVVQAGGPPCLIVQRASGKVVGAAKLPATAEGVVAVLKSYRGQ